ncbi:MAG: DUF86 domain-containing protein [Alphaproteobacteria bacterium]
MSSENTPKIAAAIAAARENIALIRGWAAHRSLESLKADTMARYAIERAFIALATAIRDIPSELLASCGIPASMIAGFRNVLAHTYDDVMDERVILTIKDDLPALDQALAAMARDLSQGKS